MARVAREMVQKAGIDVDKLLDLLIRNASAELPTSTTTQFFASISLDWRGKG